MRVYDSEGERDRPTRLRTEYPLAARTGAVPLGADCTHLEPGGGTLRCPGCGRRVKTLYVSARALSRCGHCLAVPVQLRILLGAAAAPESSAPRPPSRIANSATGRTGDIGTPARARLG